MTDIIKINNKKFRKNTKFEESIQFIKEDNPKLSTELIIKYSVMAMASLLQGLVENEPKQNK